MWRERLRRAARCFRAGPAVAPETFGGTFADKIVPEPNSGCWLWTGASNEKGYANYWRNGTCVGAHRWVWQQLFGPVPDGMHLDHLCRVRCCVHPMHLEPVTPRENASRGDSWRKWVTAPS